MKNCSAKLNSKIHFKLNSVLINGKKNYTQVVQVMMDHHSVISFNWNLWDTLKKNIEDIYDSTDCCLPQATFMTTYGFNWQNITAIENSQLKIEDAHLFRCCCLVAPRLFTFCALFCRFILKWTVNRQKLLTGLQRVSKLQCSWENNDISSFTLRLTSI